MEGGLGAMWDKAGIKDEGMRKEGLARRGERGLLDVSREGGETA
jgi:hypothetical protein